MDDVGREQMGKEVELAFGRRIRELRQARGYTQEALGAWMTAAGYPMRQNTVANLESGRRPTSVSEVAALGALFKVPIGEFFDLSGDVDAYVELAGMANAIASIKQELAEIGDRQAILKAELEATQSRYDERKRQIDLMREMFAEDPDIHSDHQEEGD